MVRYYNNRELAGKLEVNLARWKRWSRSFLPPDPLGGMQSGYARQYLFKDLFKVYLGGFLIGHLKLTVAQSQQVLVDISPWLDENGFLDWNNSNGKEEKSGTQMPDQTIYFCPLAAIDSSEASGFHYQIREVVQKIDRHQGSDCRTSITYRETYLPASSDRGACPCDHPQVRVINLTALFHLVVQKLVQPEQAV